MTTPGMDSVADDEALYRCVRHDQPDRGLFFTRPEDGALVVSSQAFSDRHFRPSVDRAELRDHDPARSRWSEADGVVSVMTWDVRAIDGLAQNDKDGKPIASFKADVEPKPVADNPAHAEIFTTPSCPSRVFRRLCERLAWLAVWEIKPGPSSGGG